MSATEPDQGRERVAAVVASWLERVARGARPSSTDIGDLYVQAAPLTLVAPDTGRPRRRPHPDDLPAVVEIRSRTDRSRWLWTSDGLAPVFGEPEGAALSVLGFHPPDADRPNWWRLAEAASRITVARAVVDVLVDVCGIPLDVVAADLGISLPGLAGGAGRRQPETACYYAIVDRIDPDAVLDLLAREPGRPGSPPGPWYRRTKAGWVADPTMDRRLARKTAERLRSLDPQTATQVERCLVFR